MGARGTEPGKQRIHSAVLQPGPFWGGVFELWGVVLSRTLGPLQHLLMEYVTRSWNDNALICYVFALVWQRLGMTTPGYDSALVWQRLGMTMPGYDNALVWQRLGMTTPWDDNMLAWQYLVMTTPWFYIALTWYRLDMTMPYSIMTTPWYDNAWVMVWQRLGMKSPCFHDNAFIKLCLIKTTSWNDNDLIWKHLDKTIAY